MSPEYDFGEYDPTVYAELLSIIITSVIEQSTTEMPCENIKFHFRSPADVMLFSNFAEELNKSGAFKHVKMFGSWLEIIK